jgi:hypothetical protein
MWLMAFTSTAPTRQRTGFATLLFSKALTRNQSSQTKKSKEPNNNQNLANKMKKLLLTLTVVAASALTMYGQGRVAFNNLSATGITVGSQNQGAGGGTAGQFVGATYSMQLVWAPVGTYATDAALYAARLGESAATPFFGTTGGGPTSDGAGFFDGGVIPNPVGTSMPAGNYTMMARAWFNTGFATYDLAKAGGRNTGYAIFNQAATAFPAGAPVTVFTPFTVGTGPVVPEPSTFALAGLGAAALLLFRRRK